MAQTCDLLYLFTQHYPYDSESNHWQDIELRILARRFKKVLILPYRKKENQLPPLPSNVEVIDLPQACPAKGGEMYSSRFGRLLSCIKFLVPFFRVMFFEFFHCKSKIKFLKVLPYAKSFLLQIMEKSVRLEEIIGRHAGQRAVFYASWFDEWATMLALIKMKTKNYGFVSRAHGYDVYEERWTHGIIPFRNFQLEMADKVFPDSKRGTEYLKEQYPRFSKKISCAHLGTPDMDTNPFNPDECFTLLSCSALIPLKRVHLIAEALRHCNFPLRWIHIGKGPLLGDIRLKTKNLPGSIEAELTGYITRDEILAIYSTRSVNLFIHTSETEGLPGVLMEAASFGIPLMGCNVGGVPEIINDETGILLPKEITPEEIAGAIASFKNSRKNTGEFRRGVREFWKKNFNAEVNYNRFIDGILISS